jgi:proteasome alpha subunit
MSYSFYDFNNAITQRNEYIENQLRGGSPVVALSCDAGVLLVTVRTTQRKIFEIYDRIIMGGLGKQSDIEGIRLAAIDSAHREGFQRSEDDVSVQRLVGFGLSPAVKRVYNDQQAIPLTLRAIFAEVHRDADDDQFFTLGYDGEFRNSTGSAVAAGTAYAEQEAAASLKDVAPASFDAALKAALAAWAIARTRQLPVPEKLDDDFDEGATEEADPKLAVRELLETGAIVEAGVLDRKSTRESRFHLLTSDEIEPALKAYR